MPVKARCRRLQVASASGAAAAPGTPLGQVVLRYADGSVERLPLRAGQEALALESTEPPQSLDPGRWLIEREGEPARVLVREWASPHPDQVLEEASFLPDVGSLEVGFRLLAVTAEVD
ncbi:MAG: hypothetical protein HYU66_03610 [Armatimonadetes bacterium]|nr:hypothetical protein [Armatimonadota bacterium]